MPIDVNAKKFTCRACNETFFEKIVNKPLKMVLPTAKNPEFEQVCEDCFIKIMLFAKQEGIELVEKKE